MTKTFSRRSLVIVFYINVHSSRKKKEPQRRRESTTYGLVDICLLKLNKCTSPLVFFFKSWLSYREGNTYQNVAAQIKKRKQTRKRLNVQNQSACVSFWKVPGACVAFFSSILLRFRSSRKGWGDRVGEMAPECGLGCGRADVQGVSPCSPRPASF